MNLETMVYYLIIVNIVGFLVYFLNYMLRTHTKGKQINILIYLISLAGGAAGMLAAVLLFCFCCSEGRRRMPGIWM